MNRRVFLSSSLCAGAGFATAGCRAARTKPSAISAPPPGDLQAMANAVLATPRGEVEAAKACGFSKRKRLFRIILPSAFRRALPAYSNEVIFMLHGSAVASTVTLQDILGVGRWLNGRYYLAYEGFITAAVLYMILVFGISRIFRFIEKRWLRHLRPREETETEDKPLLAGARF